MAKFVLKKRCKHCGNVLNEQGECTCATFIAEKEARERIEQMQEDEKAADEETAGD